MRQTAFSDRNWGCEIQIPREKRYIPPGLIMISVTVPQTHACQPFPSLRGALHLNPSQKERFDLRGCVLRGALHLSVQHLFGSRYVSE